MKESKKAGKKVTARAGPGGRLTSFKGGMQTIIEDLEEKIAGKIKKGKPVEKIEKKDTNQKTTYKVYLKDGKPPLEADVIVTAAPAYTTTKMMEDFDTDIAKELHDIPYIPMSVIALGYNREELKQNLDGFGFLIARNEKRRIIGGLWTSSIYPDRSPEDKFLLRVMIGGANQPELAMLADNEEIIIAKEELKDIMGIDAEPVFTKVFTHKKAIPQYPLGHTKRLEHIEKRLEKHPGIYMTGNALRGIGVNHCTQDAIQTAEKVIQYLK